MDNQRAEIGRLSSMGVRPQTIEAVLRESNLSACFTRRNIYNVRMAERPRQLGGRCPVDYLVQRLQNEEGWLHAMQSDDVGHIRFLIFAHQKSIDYANWYNRVFLLDFTYKTNRYRMPLLLQGRVTNVLLYVPLVCEYLTKCTFALRQGFVLLGKNSVPLPTTPLGKSYL
jgi:hypothetical protein